MAYWRPMRGAWRHKTNIYYFVCIILVFIHLFHAGRGLTHLDFSSYNKIYPDIMKNLNFFIKFFIKFLSMTVFFTHFFYFFKNIFFLWFFFLLMLNDGKDSLWDFKDWMSFLSIMTWFYTIEKSKYIFLHFFPLFQSSDLPVFPFSTLFQSFFF